MPGTFAIYPDTMHPSEMKNNRIVGIFGIVVMMCYNNIIKMFFYSNLETTTAYGQIYVNSMNKEILSLID